MPSAQTHAAVTLTEALIRKHSITPIDGGCQALMIQRLEKIGFQVEVLNFGDVTNFWARRGEDSPLLTFAGHTDVVPTGPLDLWNTDPFEPTIIDGILYGRGAADMKGSLAAMVVACENFVANNPTHTGSIGFLITSDEEGIAVNGTVKVVEHLEKRKEKIDYCIVGEPTSSHQVGDTVKNGRRGSLGAKLVIKGIQGHVAYPQLASNPIHLAMPAIDELSKAVWDEGNEFFPATSFQVSNINSGTGATNVIPGDIEIVFNFRFSTEQTEQDLRQKTEAILKKHQLNYHIEWNLSGHPFLTSTGPLIAAMKKSIQQAAGIETELSTSGGTSDGRFIAPTGTQVVELGPCNSTIHKVNECIAIDELPLLTTMYEHCLEYLLPNKS
ncbi:MAG: succinyl-diaminopimelate desuccinylase [Pseudomonadales bacterium]|nr:succinyl-diaminopimelate desuccinylase [Pseudomonadales bacterium]